LATYYIILS